MSRKDKEFQITVEMIKNLLAQIGVETYIASHDTYKECWHSVRIEVVNMYGIGSNGKGISYEAALASGYGELMERLESGFLLGKCFPLHRRSVFSPKNEEYYDVINERLQVMDSSVIDISCGTNGLSAGNSYPECFIQGSCEIYERYVLKQLYCDHNIWRNLNIISREFYAKRRFFRAIEEIEARGYNVKILDCTLEKRLPVLAVVIENLRIGKYVFALGADFNFDICVERCITELYQGKKFDLSFRLQMQSLFKLLKDSERDHEFIKAFLADEGRLPFEILNINSEIDQIDKPFIWGDIKNYDLIPYALNIFKRMGTEVYVKDYGWLGFPCLRIYSPGMSEIFSHDNKLAEEIRNVTRELNELIGKKKKDYRMLALLLRENAELVESISVMSMLGIIIKQYNCNYLWLHNTDLFLALVAFLAENAEMSEKHMEKVDDSYGIYALKVLNNIGTVDKIYNPYLKDAIVTWFEMIKTFIAFECKDCNHCNMGDVCSFQLWEDIERKCLDIKNVYIENYLWIKNSHLDTAESLC